ncbi:MAG: hypothetical protein SFX18_10175 [Pirellulales bacterium]|nr:hypothetical protein [Pirellulales bacterium]
MAQVTERLLDALTHAQELRHKVMLTGGLLATGGKTKQVQTAQRQLADELHAIQRIWPVVDSPAMKSRLMKLATMNAKGDDRPGVVGISFHSWHAAGIHAVAVAIRFAYMSLKPSSEVPFDDDLLGQVEPLDAITLDTVAELGRRLTSIHIQPLIVAVERESLLLGGKLSGERKKRGVKGAGVAVERREESLYWKYRDSGQGVEAYGRAHHKAGVPAFRKLVNRVKARIKRGTCYYPQKRQKYADV